MLGVTNGSPKSLLQPCDTRNERLPVAVPKLCKRGAYRLLNRC